MSLRLRLTLAYVVLLVPALIAFSLVVYFIASGRLYGALDDSLQARIDAVESQLPRDHDLTRAEIAPKLGAIEPATGFTFRVLDRDGRTLYSSSPSAERVLPSIHAFETDKRFLTKEISGQELRLAYGPVLGAGGEVIGYVESVTSLKQTDYALNELASVFIAGGILVVLLTGVPAYLLAGRALRPIRQVSALATEIERTADFTKLLPAHPAKGEVAELVEAFNAMIRRVERMLVTQRDFLAESSHELRRPLAVLRAYIDLLREPALPDAERRACLDEMCLEAETMARLLSDLLLLSREGEQTVRRDNVDLSALCAHSVRRLAEDDSAHRITADIAPSIRVVGDSEKIEQLVRNLLENAAQYTPAGGEIGLKLSKANGFARMQVTDSGQGIPADERGRVFERFFRGREARSMRRGGSGLGLSIVKHVAESHGGSVFVASQPGSGTSFVVDLAGVTEAQGEDFTSSSGDLH